MSRITRFILTLAVISLIGFIDLFAATAPSRQARYISFSNVTSTSVDITMVKGNGNKRVIVFSTDASIDIPIDGTQYATADGTLGNAITIAGGSDIVIDNLVGSEWFTTISGLASGQQYYVQVFEYNEDGSNPITAFHQGTNTNNPRSFTTLVTVNPPTALTVDALTLTATTADLSWTAADPAPDGYIFSLLVDEDGEGSTADGNEYDGPGDVVQPFDELDISDDTEFDLTDLVGPSDYKYQLYSYIGNSNSTVAELEFFTPEDNTPPNVASIVLSGQTGTGGAIYEGDAGNNVTFTLTFTEKMKTWLTPTFTFSNTTDLTYVTGSWDGDGDVFTATFLVSDNDQEFIDEDITIGNAEDLAGLLISAGNPTATDVFSIDNKDGVLSAFDYETAGTNDSQPHCKSGVNNDVIEIEITLNEIGFDFNNNTNTNFNVFAENDVQTTTINFGSSTVGPNGVYLFTATLDGSEDQDDYDLTIVFTDGAGNEIIQVEEDLFRIDHVAPVISNETFTNTCLQEGAVLSFSFDVVEEGCGTFDATNISISGLPAGNGVLSAPTITGNAPGPYNVAYTYTIGTTTPEGLGNVVIDVTDDAGNAATTSTNTGVFTVDKTAPTLAGLTLTSESCVNNGTDKITFTFTGYDDGCGTFDESDLTVTSTSSATPQFDSKTGAGISGDAYVFTYTLDISDTDGDYSISVNATDDAGNSSTPLEGTNIFRVDNTLPIVSNVQVTPGCTSEGTEINITFNVVEEGCFSYETVVIGGLSALDLNPLTKDQTTGTGTVGDPYVLSFRYTLEAGDPDGDYDVVIQVDDDATNSSTNNDAGDIDFSIDNTAPVISNLNVTSASCLNNGTDKLTFTFNVVEEGCGTFTDEDLTVVTGVTDATPNITQTGDGTSSVPYLFTYTYDVNGEADGEKTITVDATDDQGNVASTLTATDAFTVDNTAPTITNVALDNSCVKNTDVITLTFDVTDVITSHCGAIDNSNITVVNNEATSGNLNEAFAYQSVVTNGNVLTFTYTMTVDETNSIDDSYTVNIDVDDKAGNSATTNTDASFTVDNTKPVINGVSMNTTCENGGNTVTLTFTATEAGCGTFDQNDITITDDVTTANAWTYSTGPIANVYTYTLLLDAGDPDGLVTVSINATDDAGNDADENSDATFTIDNTAPTFSNVSVDETCINGGNTVTLTFDVAEAGCGTFDQNDITITDDVATANAWTYSSGSGAGTYTYTLALDAGDPDGLLTVSIDATDDAGNAATTNTDATFTIDNTAPIISALLVTPSCVTTDEVVTITFSVEEVGCGTFNADDIELTINDDGFGPQPEAIYEPTVNLTGGTGTNGDPYTFSATFTILSSHIDGEYVVTVTATDDAGNSDSDFDTFDVDQTPPTLSNLVTSSVPGGSPTKVGGSAPNRELTIAFDEVTDGCANFDNGTITYIITGPGNTALTVSPAAPTKTDDTWTTTVTVPSNEPSGNYQIIIIAADDNGNADTLDPAGVEFVIDNTPPQVSSVTTSHTAAGPFPPAPVLNRADDDATPPEFYIDVVYNEALDAGQAIPTLEFHIPGKNPTSPVAALTLGVATRPNANTLRYPYDLDNTTNIDMRTIGVRINGLNDVVGNTQTVANTKGSLFGIDFQTPQLNSVTPTPNFIVDGSSQLGLLFSFSEDMKTDVKPVVSFDAGNGPDNDSLALVLTYNDGESIWNSAQLFTAKFDVDGSHPLDSDPIAVGLTVATDLAGNPFPGSNESGVFIVDTKEPTCVSLTTDPVDPVVNLGDLDFTVTVVMDQTLDNGVTPTITFATSSAFSVSGGAYSTTTNTDDTYTFTVTHNGTTEEELEEIMSITGFKDLAGNVQVIACLDTFDVDTDKPDLVSVTVSDTDICTSDDEATFTVTLIFDEEMDGVTAPVLTFNPDHSSIFTNTSGAWSQTTLNNDTYTFTSTLDLASIIDADDIDIAVSAAKDVLGNTMDVDNTAGADAFSIDTEEPGVSNIAFNPIPSNAFGVNRSNIGANGFQVVITYSEDMNPTPLPTITFNDPQGGTGSTALALTAGTGEWTSSNVFTQNYTVNDEEVELDGVNVTITNGVDLCGNVQSSSNPEPSFAIDLIAPTCDGLYVEYSLINENELESQQLFANFSEPMDESIEVQFNFAVSENFTIQNDGDWNSPYEFIISAFHNGTEEGRFTETITLDLSGTKPKDLAGNPIESATCDYDFDVDTRKPLVSSVSFSPEKIIATTSSFFVTIVFDEDMKAAPNPTIGFNETLPGLFNYIGYTTPNTNTFVYEYGVTDVDLELMDVDIDIAIGQDVAGNVMSTHTSTETFNIDQVEPTVTSVTFSSHPGWINRTNIGNGNFTVTVVYDEAMDNTMAPTIDLDPFAQGNPLLSDALVFASGAWSTGSNTDDTYTATYNVIDVAFADEQLGATISSGKDACGNTQVTYNTDSEGDGVIDIDLVNPTVVFDGFTPLAESCVNGTEAIDFTANDVNFFNKVEARIGAASFATFTSGSDLSAVSGWGTATDGPITIELKALDLAGNETIISRVFTKDATAPVISNVQFTNTCVTTGDVVTLTFDVAENGCGTFDSDDITITGFTNSFIADGGNPTGSGTYTFTLLIDGDDTEGSKSVTINASDASGNAATPSVNNHAFTIDKTAPNYSLNTPASTSCTKAGTTVSMVINSDDNTFSCGSYGASNISASVGAINASVSSLGGTAYRLDINTTGLTDGAKDVAIVMTDAAGNVRNETITNAFTIDNTAPVVSNVTVTPGCENGGDIVTLTFDVVENGCGTFDQNDITINDNVATNNAWTYVSGSGSGTYTYTLLLDITDPNGAVDVSVDATDDAGNSSTGNDAGDTDFTIDNAAPVVAFTNPTSGATVNSSKVLNFTATDGAGCGITSTEVSVDNTNWFAASSGITDLGDITQFGGLLDGGFTLYIRSTDVAGNVGTSSIALVKDAAAPSVSSVTVSHPIINIADDGEEFTVTIVYNEGMDTSTDPDVNITVVNTIPSSATSGIWTNSNTYVASFGNIDVSTPETVSDLDISILNSYDDTEDDGNVLAFEVEADAFDIDTEAPTCSTMTNNNPDIYENDLSVTVTVMFTENMSTSVNPTFLVTGTTQLTPGATNWSGNTFTQTFTHTGVEETTSANFQIDTGAPLPTDLAGNPVSAVLCSTDVDIDTRKPLVSSVVFSTSLITESTTSLDVTVNFDEDMSTPPTIEFNTLLPGLLTYNSVSSTSTSFTYNYSVADANLDLDDITVDVAIGEDVAGNVMLTHTSTESFDIDQVAPTITDASIKSSNSIDDQYARVGHDIILTLTPSEELNTSSFSGNIAGYSINSISDQFGLNGTYVLTVSTDPSVSAGLVTFSIGYEDINGNAGATLTSVTDASSVTVDKTAPVGTIALASGQSDPTSDSPINFSLTFSEDVYGLTDSDIDVSGTAGATTAVITGSGDTYNVAVSGMTGSGTVVINLANGKVTDIAANGNVNTVLTDNSVQYDVSGATDVAAGAGVEPATLSSLVDTQGEAVLNFDFAVTDDGAIPATDLLATLITDITISQGSGNDFADWTTILSGAVLTDGTNTVAASSINSSTIQFTGLAHGAGQIGEVADNATKTYTLKVWLSDTPTGVIDNMNLAFKVNRSSFTVDGARSSFAGGAGTDIESGSTNNAIDVDATELAFTTTPVKTVINTNTTFVIDATDANGNRDVDYGPSTVTLTPNLSTISSGGSGTLTSGTLTLSTVQFSNAFANDYVTAADGTLTDGVSANFNIKEAAPASITNLSIIPNSNSFKINFTNPDNKNTLIIAKKTSSTTLSYSNEAGMDDETSWVANTNYGSSATPSDASTFVIYAGSGATSVTMYNLINNFQRYTIAAYAYAGALNSGVQNFNETETTKSGLTMPKGSNYSESISNGLRLGIDNITPQPASLNNTVSLQVETVEDMPLTLELYDSKGQLIMTLFDGKEFSSGETPFEFNLTNNVSSGQHFLRLTGNGHVVIAPFMIVK